MPLGQLQFNRSPAVTALGVDAEERTIAETWAIGYGDFRMRHPRFIRYSHVLWFTNGEIANWRRSAGCGGTEMHPWVANASLPSYFAARPDLPLKGQLHGFVTSDDATQRLRTMLVQPLRDMPLYELEHVARQLRPEGDIPPHGGWLHFCDGSDASGEVSLLLNAEVSPFDGNGVANHDCGQSGDVRTLVRNAAAQRAYKPDVTTGNLRAIDIAAALEAAQGVPPPQNPASDATVFYGVITASALYQHWVQNTLPKIAAATLAMPELQLAPRQPATDRCGDGGAWLQRASGADSFEDDALEDELPACKGVPERARAAIKVQAVQPLALDRFPIIGELYSHLDWEPPLESRSITMRAHRLVYSCKQPPLHPLLWQVAQTALLQAPAPKPLAQRRKIVYCGRSRMGRTENDARRVVNEEAVLSLLARWGSQQQRNYTAPADSPATGTGDGGAAAVRGGTPVAAGGGGGGSEELNDAIAASLAKHAASHMAELDESQPSSDTMRALYNATGEQQRVDEMRRRLAHTPDHELYQAEASDDGWAGYEIVEFDHRKYPTVESLLEFWSDARALIGPHGGCLTNVVFMPANSLVVELYPLVGGTRSASPHMAMMMYMQSMFLEHEYWMLPQTTWSRKGHFKVDTALLCEILGVSLGMPPGHDSLDACAGEFSAHRPGITQQLFATA